MKPKIGDIFVYVFIGVLIGLSFLGLKAMATHKDRVIVHVELDGKLVESIEIGEDEAAEGTREIRVDTGDDGYNVIRLLPEGIDVADANCPDKLCVRSPRIKAPGQSIICIPHKLVVRIVGENLGNDDVDDTAS